MCGPVAIPIAAAAIAAASSGYQARQAYVQGKVAKDAAARNALIGRQAAADAEARGEVEAARIRSQTARMQSRALAAMLTQGGGDGMASVLEGIGISGETDAETVLNNAARQAWGYRNQADTSIYEGEIASSRATSEMYGSILTGAGNVASSLSGLKGTPKRKLGGNPDGIGAAAKPSITPYD